MRPTIDEICGQHKSSYLAFFKQVDSGQSGNISAPLGAQFLKKSQLSDRELSQIWELSDAGAKGYLTLHDFCVALKLIALRQANRELNAALLKEEVPPPTIGDPGDGWQVTQSERLKYEQVFRSLNPVNGKLSGESVRPVLLNSKLGVDVLRQLWQLADVDADGALDLEEFSLAMHLIYKVSVLHETLPPALTPSLIPPTKRKTTPGVPAPAEVAAAPGPDVSDWAVPVSDVRHFDPLFTKTDTDHDGFVTGPELKDVLLQSGLPPPVLAHIWQLCDTQNAGRLNREQFTLCMFLIQKKMKGVEPPTTLPPNMVPPSMRRKLSASAGPTLPTLQPTHTEFEEPPEVKALADEVAAVRKERVEQQTALRQLEATASARRSEASRLTEETDRLAAAVAQLESQKTQADGVLESLDEKIEKCEESIASLVDQYEEELEDVKKAREEVSTLAAADKEKQEQLSTARQELATLRQQAGVIELQLNERRLKSEREKLEFSSVACQIEAAEARISELQTVEEELKKALEQFDALVAGGGEGEEPNLDHPGAPVDAVMEVFWGQTKPADTPKPVTVAAVPAPVTPSPVVASPPVVSPPVADPFASSSADPFASSGADPFASSGSDGFAAFGNSGSAPAATTASDDPWS